MSGINKVILIGRLGQDPEIRVLDNGTKVASFSLATSESYTDKNTGEKKETTEWHKISMWRNMAELAEKYLQKGSQVYLEGKLKTNTYEKDGTTVYTTGVVAYSMQFLGGKNESQAQSQQPAPETHDDSKDDLPF
jgi:single-strand DNA-binding protein